MIEQRGSGILLHISSLPSQYGIGDFGPKAYKFVDFLSESKQIFWQILPLNPIEPFHGNSPYSSISAFAGNTLFISPEIMFQDGLLTKKDIEHSQSFPLDKVNYPEVIDYKEDLFNTAYKHFKKKNYDFERFCFENSNWLEDFALFSAFKMHFHGRVWSEWPREIKNRIPESLQTLKNELFDKIEKEKFLQYLFFQQWFSLKKYCHDKGIQIIGDIPIYVDYDSVDLWTNPEIFKLDDEKKLTFFAGVPPDYFSKTGQQWGNPVYNWDMLKSKGYLWWIKRLEHNINLFDLVRIDHFRGFVAYWEIPVYEKTAVNGRWVEAPAEDFFRILTKHFHHLPIVAEDLGYITPDVREVMNRFNFPGMKVLLFAFDEDISNNPYIPHNYKEDCVVYTGTHDTNTIRGWFEKEATYDDKARLFQYLGREVPSEQLNWELIRLAMMSVANIVILPMQDILGLAEEGMMNRPSTSQGNWEWRILEEQLTSSLSKRLSEMTKIYGRE